MALSCHLSAPVFHILVALSDQERHGYGIMLDVSEQTSGTLELGPGTLYGCLNRIVGSWASGGIGGAT